MKQILLTLLAFSTIAFSQTKTVGPSGQGLAPGTNAAFRTALGLGSASTLNTGIGSGNVVIQATAPSVPSSVAFMAAGQIHSMSFVDLFTELALDTAANQPASAFEPALGNPGTNGYVLSSTTAGVRSWIALAGGDLLSTNNLSELTNYGTARTNLGLAIGTNVQAWDADLDTWATKTAPSGSVVGTSDTQTLTGKTLTSPIINVTSDATGDLYYRDAGGAFTRLPVGSSGHVLTVASGLPSWAAAAGSSLTNFTESVNTSTPNATVPAVQLIATNAATNVDAVISPKGAGSLLAQIPDNSTTGGNKRGDNAVDWQQVRSSNTSVASGTESVIGGGYRNRASGTRSTVGGGISNNATGSNATVAGGNTNTASGTESFATNNNNTASGGQSFAAGHSNTVSGLYSQVFGLSNTVSGSHNFAAGGTGNNLSGSASVAMGSDATNRGIIGVFAQASGNNLNSLGIMQSCRYVIWAFTNGSTPTIMQTTSSTGTRTIVLPNNSTYSFTGQVSARSSTGDSAAWRFTGTIERGANAAATALVGTPTMTDTNAEAGASTWVLDITANTTAGGLELTATGVAATNIRWVAQVETAEVVY